MKRLVIASVLVLPLFAGEVELIRDRWGIPHAFASNEADAFFGIGHAAAEDRLLQMDLFRRRATGRLAEVFGEKFLDSDRKFRAAGMERHCREAASGMPADIRAYLTGYAAGVNAWVAANPDKAVRRLAPLGTPFEPWTEADCVCAWMAVAENFDRLFDEGAARMYDEFRQLAAEVGEAEALRRRGMMIDDEAAVVPESEMARNEAVYGQLKATPPQPGFWRRSLPDEMLQFSHAWAVAGSRTTTGKPLLESDPQTPVSNPPLWYEFHVSGGRFDVRGIGVAGSPAMLIGFNRFIAWGASALGAGSGVTFIEKLTPQGDGYMDRGVAAKFERNLETIHVKGAEPVTQEVLRTRHGFVFNSLVKNPPAGEAWVSHFKPIEDKVSSILGLLNMMGSGDWHQFREAMEWYYSPGLHVVYADVHGRIAYQTLVHVPKTKRTPRMALEGWTGEDEVMGRIPLEEMPNMADPAADFVSHANNLPVGSWYPYDLGIATGGIGHTARSLRLLELLAGRQLFSVESFEAAVHRDDVHASVAAMYPVARRLAEGVTERDVAALLDALKNWDLRFRADQASYPAASALARTALLSYRRSGLNERLGGGEGGIAHLARLLKAQFGAGPAAPHDEQVRAYLLSWIRAAAQEFAKNPRGADRQHSMPFQTNGPLGLPSLDPALDLVSPPLSCPETGTIWSQPGNSYTQIVDLDDVDNSRTLLPPGISEDPESPFHTDQMEAWVRGTTHAAPLSRHRVEELASSRVTLDTGLTHYTSPVRRAPARVPAGRFIAAIPAGVKQLPGRKPDDSRLELGLRYLIRPERTEREAAAKAAELKSLASSDPGLQAQLVGGLRLVLHLDYGNEAGKKVMRDLLRRLHSAPSTPATR